MFEVLKQLEQELLTLELPPEAGEVINGLLTKSGMASTDEIAWAFRKLLEAAALKQPLVCVFDDIQWGEEAFLDLVEHVAYLFSQSALLLCCIARPDLLDRRAGWGGVLTLEPLAPGEAEQLVDLRLGERTLEPGLRERILSAAAGNALFLEEMAAMLHEAGTTVAVPPTIKALLAGRLDQLEPGERRVLECGAIEGELFHLGAVHALAPEETRLTTRLTSIVRKELVRPDRPQLPGEDGFRFRHLLIRDAAYDSLPKATRAELHERFADWLAARALAEFDEIIGYHLEQAYRYRAELGPADEQARNLAGRATEHLAAAGVRASLRADVGAAISLFRRALELMAGDARDIDLEVKFADALFWAGRLAEAEALLSESAARAAARGDRRVELRALLERTRLAMQTSSEGKTSELLALAEQAIPLFEQAGDESGLARAWRIVSWVELGNCRYLARKDALERALIHAGRAGDELLTQVTLNELGIDLAYDPTPVDEALRWYEEHAVLEVQHPVLRCCHAALEAMRGRFEEARLLLAQARARQDELADRLGIAMSGDWVWLVEMLAGDPAAAERAERQACQQLEELGERGWLSTQAAHLSRALSELGRDREAEQWSRRCEQLGASDDVSAQMLWRQTRATLLARRGDLERAESLAQEAVALGAKTDMLSPRRRPA